MLFLTQGKTNWKFIGIVAILAVVVGGGILLWLNSDLSREKVEAPKELTKEGAVKTDEDLIFDKFGFFLILPDDWEVKVEKKAIDSFSFSFIPPEGLPLGWDFWGVLYLDIHESRLSIDEWVEKHLPAYTDDLLIERVEDVGGKPTFVLDIKEKDMFWVPKYIILGNEYSYEYSFSQDGAAGFVQRIIEEIFPNITILSADETVNWQIYRNEEHGFEMKYPVGWEKGEVPGAENELLFNINFIETISNSHKRVFWPGSFRIGISPNTEQLSLEEWIKGYKREAATGADLIQEITDTTLDGKIAKKVLVFGFDHTEIVIITINDEMIYNLSFDDAGLNNPDRYQHQQIYDQMLSAFRFLE